MKKISVLAVTAILVYGLFFSVGPRPAQGSDPIPVTVGGVGTNPLTQSAAVLLYAESEKLVLPIFIGSAEAGAISRYLDGVRTPRPMTHDLIGTLLDVFDGQLEQVTVSDFRDNTYFALLIIRVGDQTIRVDARPSDAIAIALKQKAPIDVERKIMEALGYLHDGEDFVPPVQPPVLEEDSPEWI